MRFEFATAERIIFGPGTLREIGPVIQQLGRRALVVVGRDQSRADHLLAALNQHRITSSVFQVTNEPTLQMVEQGTAWARREQCDMVIGFGGGSPLDAGKAIAAMMTNPGDIMQYLEVIGRGQPLQGVPAPFVAIPTTAGTGTEVTRNAVLTSTAHKVKVSLRSPLMLPKVVLIDPELTYGLPPAVTAATGMDALSQLIEPYVSLRSNPVSDTFCEEGMRRVARSLRAAYANGGDVAAREDMALASMFSGMALANAGAGAVHGMASPIGGMFPAPHGAVCAALLSHVMDVNLRCLRSRAIPNGLLHRFDRIGQLLCGTESAGGDQAVEWVAQLVSDLRIPTLSSYGIGVEHVPALVDRSSHASSMKSNPVALTLADLEEILGRSL